ncbi:DUF2207 domain-containing protein [Kribbella sp. C-35]|uniref:DUF2207 domain-containing protein n=1 Tax=Kribbella sp. C-35 TaxID=2789276 RepID=UPI00397D346E
MVDGRVIRVVALAAIGLAVAGIVVPAVREGERFYPGRLSGAHIKAQYEIRTDGDLDVTETIDYEYNASGMPLDRAVQLRRPVEETLDQQVSLRSQDRVWTVTHLSATDRSGAPVPVRTKELDPVLPPLTGTGIDGWDSRLSDLRIQIGERNKEAGDKASYILRYRVHGALDWAADGYELNWPDPVRMTGNSWGGEPMPPVDEVRVVAPATITRASCSAYPTDRPTPCVSTQPAVFTPGRTRAAMIVKVAVPATGIASGGGEYDGSPVPRDLRILLIGVGAILFLALVGFVAHCLIRGFPLRLRKRA